MLRLDFITLFPEVILPSIKSSMLARAASRGLVEFQTVNPRDYTYDRHAKVDDTPFGGEPGMLIKAEPVAQAIESVLRPDAAVVLTDPAGMAFAQSSAQELTQFDQILFVCGHYEGIDDRVCQRFVTHRFSIGDYVLTNGEMPALVMADAVVRLLPGVLGDEGSLAADSYHGSMLSAPNYTRPEVWRDESIPAVLKSGDHKKIVGWRVEQSLSITKANRPDLLAQADFSLPPKPKRRRKP